MDNIMNEPLDWLDEIINSHGKSRTSLIPVLQSVQSKYRYLPEPVVNYISEKMSIPLSSIYGVATFYAQFSTEPKGKHLIQVCVGTACHVRGAKELVNRLRKDYNLTEENRTTDDKLLTLETVACIGACAMAPAVIVDGRMYGHLKTGDLVSELIVKFLEENKE